MVVDAEGTTMLNSIADHKMANRSLSVTYCGVRQCLHWGLSNLRDMLSSHVSVILFKLCILARNDIVELGACRHVAGPGFYLSKHVQVTDYPASEKCAISFHSRVLYTTWHLITHRSFQVQPNHSTPPGPTPVLFSAILYVFRDQLGRLS